jgi:hypothetical protein
MAVLTLRGIAARLSSYVSVSQGCLLSQCQLLSPFLFLFILIFFPLSPPPQLLPIADKSFILFGCAQAYVKQLIMPHPFYQFLCTFDDYFLQITSSNSFIMQRANVFVGELCESLWRILKNRVEYRQRCRITSGHLPFHQHNFSFDVTEIILSL